MSSLIRSVVRHRSGIVVRTLCAKCVRTKTLRNNARGARAMSVTKTELRDLLLGSHFGQREEDNSLEQEINKHLRGLIQLMPRVYGNTEPCKQAIREVKSVVDMRDMTCKRAMLLYGLSKERELCDYWRGSESATLADDLHNRVLPFVTPRFLKHCCQCPDAFVVICMVMAEMWKGEQLGNWPRAP